MTISRKDFEAVAGIIKKNLIEDVDLGFKEGRQDCLDMPSFSKDLITYFKASNPLFNEGIFLKGCGLE